MSATPGPWLAHACRHGWYIASTSEPSVVIDTADAEGRYGAIAREADAKLIAAAPDLYEALARLLTHLPPAYMVNEGFESDGLYEAALERARAALAKVDA